MILPARLQLRARGVPTRNHPPCAGAFQLRLRRIRRSWSLGLRGGPRRRQLTRCGGRFLRRVLNFFGDFAGGFFEFPDARAQAFSQIWQSFRTKQQQRDGENQNDFPTAEHCCKHVIHKITCRENLGRKAWRVKRQNFPAPADNKNPLIARVAPRTRRDDSSPRPLRFAPSPRAGVYPSFG